MHGGVHRLIAPSAIYTVRLERAGGGSASSSMAPMERFQMMMMRDLMMMVQPANAVGSSAASSSAGLRIFESLARQPQPKSAPAALQDAPAQPPSMLALENAPAASPQLKPAEGQAAPSAGVGLSVANLKGITDHFCSGVDRPCMRFLHIYIYIYIIYGERIYAYTRVCKANLSSS